MAGAWLLSRASCAARLGLLGLELGVGMLVGLGMLPLLLPPLILGLGLIVRLELNLRLLQKLGLRLLLELGSQLGQPLGQRQTLVLLLGSPPVLQLKLVLLQLPLLRLQLMLLLLLPLLPLLLRLLLLLWGLLLLLRLSPLLPRAAQQLVGHLILIVPMVHLQCPLLRLYMQQHPSRLVGLVGERH